MTMNKCRLFFLLFSNCIFLSIQAPVPHAGDTANSITIPTVINYEKQALTLIGADPDTDSKLEIDWRDLFKRLAPIAISGLKETQWYQTLAKTNEDIAKKNEDIAKINEDIAKKNEERANKNSEDAGRYNFILITRNKIVYDEEHYCTGMPKDDNTFIEQIKKDERFKDIPDSEISCKKHAKIWLWMLVKGDENINTSLVDLRRDLNNDARKYLWFVAQIQGVFDVFNDDVHSPASSLLS